MVKRVLTTYYSIVFTFELAISFFFSTYAMFLLAHGLSLFEISMVNFVFMVGCFVFEVPTGAVADGMGRKPSFIISCFAFSLSFLVYYLSHTMTGFIVAELIGALAMTLQSGAFDAWLVDSIKHYDKFYDLDPVYRSKTIINQSGRIIGTVAGAFVGQADLALPWLISGIGTFLVGVAGIFILNESYRSKEDNSRSLAMIIGIGRDSIKYGLKNRSVFYIIMLYMVFAFACMPLNMYWQVRFSEGYGLIIRELGFVHAVAMVAIIIGAQLAKYNVRFFKKQKNGILFSMLFFAMGQSIAALDLGLGIVLMGYLVNEVSRGNYSPLQAAYINERTPSRVRATVLSFNEMMSNVGAVAGLVICGFIADRFGVQVAWISAAGLVVFCLPFFYFAKNGE